MGLLTTRTCSLDTYCVSSQQFDTSLKLLLFLTKFNTANLVVCAFSDYNFAETQNDLRSPDFQDFRFLDVCIVTTRIFMIQLNAVCQGEFVEE